MKIVIDTREKDLVNLYKNENVIVKTCSVGDILFCKDAAEMAPVLPENAQIDPKIPENESDSTEVLFIIERKTWKDLGCSIIDGRFRQQKERILETKLPCLYVIEGTFYNTSINSSVLLGSILNLIYRHKIPVMYSKNLEQTKHIIDLLFKKYSTGEFEMTKEHQVSFKPRTKNEQLTENLFAHQLSLIKGLSFQMALEVVKVFPTMKDLMYSLENVPNCLEKVVLKNGKKLNKTLIERIYNSCGIHINE